MPDITMLDSHFTPYHSSSKNYSTFTGSIHYNLAMVRSHCFGSITIYYTHDIRSIIHPPFQSLIENVGDNMQSSCLVLTPPTLGRTKGQLVIRHS